MRTAKTREHKLRHGIIQKRCEVFFLKKKFWVGDYPVIVHILVLTTALRPDTSRMNIKPIYLIEPIDLIRILL